jgi:hypothetical protein
VVLTASCTTVPPYVLRGSVLSSMFYLQNVTFLEWSRGGSNPRPPPCKGGEGTSGASYRVREYSVFMPFSAIWALSFFYSIRLRSGLVAARLLHGCCTSYVYRAPSSLSLTNYRLGGLQPAPGHVGPNLEREIHASPYLLSLPATHRTAWFQKRA